MSLAADLSKELERAVTAVDASTVLVNGRRRYPASGIALAADLVLTADHVVTRDEDVSIRTASGGPYDAAVAGRDPGSDLAVLKVSGASLQPASTAKDGAKIGQLVLAVGRPGENGLQASWGIVTGIGGPTRTGRGGMLDAYFQTETTPYPGFSGGPLLNTEGSVLGINTSGLTPGSSLTIPVKVAWAIGESLARNGSVKRGYLGVRTQGVVLGATGREGAPAGQDRGLLVAWIEEESPAARGGLIVGDIIIGIADREVKDPDDIFASLTAETVGKAQPVRIVRGGKAQTLTVTIGERR
jgi:S1-C subfamily serine protease